MTRPELLRHLSSLDDDQRILKIYHLLTDQIIQAADTMSNEFQMAATVVAAIEKEAERQLEGVAL